MGFITSGCPSPTLKQNIAMGYIRSDLAKAGTQVQLDPTGKGEGKMVGAVVTKMPFVKTNYYVKK